MAATRTSVVIVAVPQLGAATAGVQDAMFWLLIASYPEHSTPNICRMALTFQNTSRDSDRYITYMQDYRSITVSQRRAAGIQYGLVEIGARRAAAPARAPPPEAYYRVFSDWRSSLAVLYTNYTLVPT